MFIFTLITFNFIFTEGGEEKFYWSKSTFISIGRIRTHEFIHSVLSIDSYPVGNLFLYYWQKKGGDSDNSVRFNVNRKPSPPVLTLGHSKLTQIQSPYIKWTTTRVCKI